MAEQGALYRIELDIKDLKRQAQEVSKTIHNIGKTAEQESSKIDGVLSKLGKGFAGFFTAQQALSFARSIVQVRSEIESLEVSFRTLLGSEEKASRLFGEIRTFAVNTPMMMNDLSKGAQMLLSFNYDAEKVMPTLKALGDISMGDSQKFMSLTLAFSQMSSTGKLMGQDLLQMINAGFNPLAEISAKTGKSVGQLKDEMAKGAISAQMVEEAFISATSEGGKFYGMLEAQSKTMAGAISNLQGAWEDMLNAIGEDAQGAFTDTVASLTNIIKHYEDFGRVLVEVIGVMGVYKAAMIANTVATAGMNAAEAAHYGWLVLVEKAQKLLNATLLKNPYALVAAAVAAIGVAIYELMRNENKLSASMQAVENVSKSFNEEIIKEQHNIDSLFAKLSVAKKGTEEYDKAKQNILTNYGGYLKGLSNEIQSLDDLKGAYDAVSKAALDSARKRARANATNSASDAMVSAQADVADEIYEILKTRFKGNALETYYQQIMASLRGNGTNITDKFYNKFNTSRDYYNRATGDSYTITTNKLKEAVAQYKRALAEYEKAMAEADRRFGTEEATTETPTDNGNTTTETQEEREKRLKELWNKNNEYEERLRKIEEYKQKIKNAQRDAEFEIAQAKIDAMEDGLEKTMRQNSLDYKKALADNADTERAMLEEYRDRMQTEWEAANPKFKEQNLQFDRLAIKELPADEIRILEQNSDIACSIYETANKKALDAALEEFKSYEQRRLEIETRYSALINSLYEDDGNGGKRLIDGVSQANIDNITKQMQSELGALTDEILKSSPEYIKFFTASLSMSVSEVEKLGDAIKQHLNNQLANGSLTIDEYTRSWNEVEAVIDGVRNQFSKFLTYSKDGVQGLINKNRELAESQKAAAISDYTEASKKGDSVGMAVAEKKMQAAEMEIEAAKIMEKTISELMATINVVTDTVGGINTLTKKLADTVASFGVDTESTSSGWAKALAVIDTLDTAATSLSNAFQSLLSGDIMGAITNLLSIPLDIIQTINKWIDKESSERIENLIKLTEELDEQVQELEETVAESYGANKKGALEAQAQLLMTKVLALEAAKAIEEAKKDPDTDAIDEYNKKIEEIWKQIKEIGESIERFLFDSDIYSEISSLGDALADAFMNGQDAAEAFATTAKDLVKQALSNIIKEYIQSAGIIKDIENKINEAYNNDGKITQDEINDIMKYAERLSRGFEWQFGWIENAFDAIGESSVTASSKGITTASQESIDELNGSVTVIQGYTYELANNSKILVNNTGDILRSVRNIEGFASDIKQKVIDIESETRDMKRAINDFEINGINIK